MRYGHKVSHISEMNFTFITNLNKITNEYYLKQSKSMLQWRIIEKLAKNPKLIKAFDKIHSHPLIREYSYFDQVEN